MFRVYNLFLTLLALLLLPILPVFLLLGKRFREGFLQRLGFYPRSLRESMRGSRSVWIHAVSVGEVLSVARLALELKRRFSGYKILLSTSTATGNRMARRMLSAVDAVVYFPLDHPWIVRRVLRLFDPSLVIFLEAEMWPNFLRASHRMGIPALLLSGRLSAHSFRRYWVFRLFFSGMFRRWSAVGMQTQEDAQRIRRLGVAPGKVAVTGNLKHAAWDPGSLDKRALNFDWDDGSGPRRVVVAGSTHRGEEELLLEAFLSLKAQFPGLRMVLAPRHPHRFAEVDRLLRKKGIRYQRQSERNGHREQVPDVVFVDTLGDLPALYAFGDIAFVGGSLVDAGGHNLFEPARCRKPIVFGPHMRNFSHVARELKEKGGGMEVRGKEDLMQGLAELLKDPGKAVQMGEIAFQVVKGDRGVVERSLELVSRYLQGSREGASRIGRGAES